MQYYLNEGLMKDLKIKLGMRIKYLRKAKNLTQEQLAEKINLDITSLSKIETGRNYPQPETIEKLACAFEIDIEEIFNFHEDFSKTDYYNKILKNLNFMKEDKEKLKLLYEISSALV